MDGENMVETTSVASLLRHVRLDRGLTQEELAERSGLSARAISDLERGLRRMPRRDTVDLLAAALELSDEEQARLASAIGPRGRSMSASAAAVPTLAPPADGAALPAPLTSFVGREREVAAISALLRAEHVRLVSLTGPGGVGKTRVALRFATELQDELDGIRWVSLAPVTAPSHLIPAIAEALQVREAAEKPLAERLLEALGSERLLLVLDNFERLAAAAPVVAELLTRCPQLKNLTTSRVTLGVSGEQIFTVPPLSLGREPGVGIRQHDRTPDSEAVQLFVARARSVQPDFVLTDDNAGAIATICARLDGLPLAIELAAARIRLLPADVLATRLDRRLPVLTGGAQDLPPRLRTMRDAIAWSYELLTEDEQQLFRGLAVFVDGFTLDAAEAVAGEKAGGREGEDDDSNPALAPSRLPAWSVFDGLAALVDHSLVQLGDRVGDDQRYQLLETIQEFGLERLEASGEETAARRRAAGYFLALAERPEPHLTSPEQRMWLDRLSAEHDNLRAVLAWSDDAGEAEIGLRLAAALALFWYVRGHPSEGRDWLEGAAARAQDQPALDALRAKALSGATHLAGHQGDFRAAVALGEEALAIARRLNDTREMARALTRLATVAVQRGEYDRATALDEEALSCHRSLGDEQGLATTLGNLGQLALNRGDYDHAQELIGEALDRFRVLGDQRGVGLSLGNLGWVAEKQDDLDRAAAFFRDAIEIDRRLGYKRGLAIELDRLAAVTHRQGDLRQSRALFGEALGLWRELGDPVDLAVWCEQFAWLEAVSGRGVSAARFLGAAAALWESVGRSAFAADLSRNELTITIARSAVGEQEFDAGWEAGRALPLEDVLSEAEVAATAVEPVAEAAAPRPFGLTAREQEVLCLLADGQSDREIAEALFISHGTARRHVANVLGKLGVGSRTAAAAIAIRDNLV